MKIGIIIVMILMAMVSTAAEYTLESEDIQNVLEKAGDNRVELEKAIAHYKDSPEIQKYDALLFLIANMEEQGFVTYRLFDTTGSDVDINVMSFPDYDSLTNTVRAIEKEKGELDYERTDFIYDADKITAEYLINQIEYAFKAWSERPWAQHYDFIQFCRYILPYRGSNEPLEPWRKYFYDKYEHIISHMEDSTNPLEAAAIINDDIMTWFGFDPRFYYHPTDQGLSEMIANKLGRCEDMTNVSIYAMRANGLAVTSDYTPYWANTGNNHAWNAIVTADGDVIPFMGAEASPGKYQLHNKAAKVYRKTYDQQKENLIFVAPEETEIPRWLKGKNYIDVTRDYVDVSTVDVMLDEKKDDQLFAYLCVFNAGHWQPIHWGRIHEGTAKFTDMGIDVAYLPAYYVDEEIVPAADPFVLHEAGEVFIQTPFDYKQTVKLLSTTKRKLVESTDGIETAFFDDGKEYELFYWDIEWKSVGTKTASGTSPLVFDEVPVNAVYWLVANDSDREERIFTIDKDGQQVWW
ncbi:MAG: transglutaminase domain-containing protein [Calditrichaeota bacterium]|nr:MAG: transglutaminase domain-containing protein [Calditrichota bacterium]